MEDKPEAKAPPEALRPPRWSRAGMVSIFVWIVASALALAALLGPWLTVVTTGPAPANATDARGYGLSGFSATGTAPGLTVTVSGNYLRWPSVASALLPLQAIVVAVIVVGLASVVLAFFAPRRRRLGRLAHLAGFLAAGLSVAACVAFVTLFPDAAEADGILPNGAGLWGSTASGSSGAAATWSPGWAWFTLLAACVLFVAGSLVLWRGERAVAARTPEAPA